MDIGNVSDRGGLLLCGYRATNSYIFDENLDEEESSVFSVWQLPQQEYCATCQKASDTGTRTRVICVRGKYANHLHHIGYYSFLLY